MLPLRIVETQRADFDGPIIEIWREDVFVGMVFWDGEASVVQVYPSGDGDVHDLELRDLVRVLDLAEQIVDPGAFEDEESSLQERIAGAGWDDEDPVTVELVGEFDPQAAHRTTDGEGFFPRAVAEAFLVRCEELGLAVVEMEGADLDGEVVIPRPGLTLTVRPEAVMGWPEFRSYANARAADALAAWPHRSSLMISFVVQQPDGETFVA